MSYKILENKISTEYGELSQKSPLRWEILFKEGDEFIPQTSLFKCTDFFNDLVGAVHGTFIKIYNFDTKKISLNKEEIFVRLHHITNMEVFLESYYKTIVPMIQRAFGVIPKLEPLSTSQALLTLPIVLFSSTFSISLFTWLVRLLTFLNKPVNDIKDLLQPEICRKDSKGYIDSYNQLICQHGFTRHERFNDVWAYNNGPYNDGIVYKNSELTSHVLHCNGVLAWFENVEGVY